MKRNAIRTVLISLLCFTLLLSSGCEKNVVKGGEGTNYPYTYSTASNGTVTVKLNGKITPDYHWTAVSDDESVVTVERKGGEHGGKATFKVKPAAEGAATVTFVRERETEMVTRIGDFATSEELAAYEAEIAAEAEPVSENSEVPSESIETSEEDENVIPIPESPRTEESARVPKDRVCMIRILFSVSPNGKKFRTETTVLDENEMEAVVSETGQGIPYQIWPDDNGQYRVNLPKTPGGWQVSYDAEYTGVMEEVLDPDTGDVIGTTGIDPPKDEEGNPIVIEAYTLGGAYDESFILAPCAPGNGTLYLSAPNEKKRLEIEFTIDEGNALLVVSSAMKDYEPTKAELDMAKVEPD